MLQRLRRYEWPDGGADAAGDGAPPADGSSDGASDAAPPTLDCNFYCSSILANCTATAQFVDMPTCLAFCAYDPPGTLSDETGNTLGCRIDHALAAATTPSTECANAGPTGGDVHGTLGDSAPYSTADTMKNDLGCRFYYLTLASVGGTAQTNDCPNTSTSVQVCAQ